MPAKKIVMKPLVSPKIVNHFAIILDSSGSMGGIERAVVDAYNQNVDTIREKSRETGQESTVTLAVFGRAANTEFPRLVEPAETTAHLGLGDYRPTGGTPLFDAIADTIDKLRLQPGPAQGVNSAFVLTVITDGEENESWRFGIRWGWRAGAAASDPGEGGRRLAQYIKDQGERWTVTFQVPRGKGAALARLGIPAGNIMEWTAEGSVEERTRGMMANSRGNYQGMSRYFVSRASGQTSTSNYYSPDLSKLDVKQVQAALDDVSDRVKIWKVNKQMPIREFVESHKMPYVLGGGYYQLMKQEKIAKEKQIIIREKGKKAIYGGAAARQLLGLPDADTKVKPGNHANYDIFVQSASYNRLLPLGTELAYDTIARPGIKPTWEPAAVVSP